MLKRIAKYDWLVVGLFALLYFGILCAKSYSWLNASGDSGDWLAGSTIWMNVQPFGSPVFILLGHLVHFLVPNHLVLGMEFGLNVLPSAITVSMTYIILKKLTSVKHAFIGALILCSAALFMAQSTILDEFALATMFVTIALWFYLNGKKKLTALFLGLASGVNIICVVISVIWFLYHWKEIKQWANALWIWFAVGVVPYSMVLILMYLPVPRLIAGSLSFGSIDNYLGSSGTVGSISWYGFLTRFPQGMAILIISLGFALVPLFVGLKKPFSKLIWLMIGLVGFNLWIYFTDSDPSTWHFLPFTFPMLVILCVLGMFALKGKFDKIVIYGATVMLVVNAIFLNANVLTNQNPKASRLIEEFKSLPAGSAVVICYGGNYGLGIDYAIAQGTDIIPIFYSALKPTDTYYKKGAYYQGYLKWVNATYNVQGNNTIEQVEYLLSQGRKVYISTPTITPYWQGVFQYQGSSDLAPVTGVN